MLKNVDTLFAVRNSLIGGISSLNSQLLNRLNSQKKGLIHNKKSDDRALHTLKPALPLTAA